MPFTFSHPAIVLPLAYAPSRWVSMTGLVIGSLTPDFEYFIRMRISSHYSHTIAGLFWFDLPLGLILAFVFHLQVRNCLFDNLPASLQARFNRFKSFDWTNHFINHYVVVIVSLLIGAASHIFWDGFTHDHGYFVEHIPRLQGTIDIAGYTVPILKLLQHSSTFLGALTIMWAIYKLPISEQTQTSINLRYWLGLAVIVIGIVGLRLLTGLELRQYGNIIVSATSATLIALIMLPFGVKLFSKPQINKP